MPHFVMEIVMGGWCGNLWKLRNVGFDGLEGGSGQLVMFVSRPREGRGRKSSHFRARLRLHGRTVPCLSSACGTSYGATASSDSVHHAAV